MTVSDRFWAAMTLARERPELSDSASGGSRLAWSADQVLRGEGAGVSLSVDRALRIPWGASSDDAALAEQLQFTAGQGPCLDAFAGGQPVMASELVITRFWPGFAESFLQRTSYRSVFAIPIGNIGVLDLYFTDGLGCLTVDVGAAVAVATEILVAVAEDDSLTASDLRTGALSITGRKRSQVPVAVGMLIAATGLDADDALAMLRAHAFAADASVDDVAGDVVDGSLDLHVFG